MSDMLQETIADRPVFIVGAPRSGTSWVQRILLSDPAVCGGQESHFFSVFGAVLQSFDKHQTLGRNVGLPSYWHESDLLDEMRRMWRKTVAPLIESRRDARLLVEKTPDHAMVLKEILELLPEARVIHVVRDSRAVVASLLAAGQTWGSHWAPKNARDAAVLWYRYTRAALAAGRALRCDQYLMIHYEDLLKNGPAEIRRLFDFLGIAISDQSIGQLAEAQKFVQQRDSGSPIPVVHGSSREPEGFFRKGTADSWREDLTAFQKLTVWRYTHKLMHELGYTWRGRED
jgi:hypothetical protein